MNLMVTGHRKLSNPDAVRVLLRGELLARQSDNLTVISGMAEGVDTIFAEEAQALDIPVIAYIPWPGYKVKSEVTLAMCHSVIFTDEGAKEKAGKLFARQDQRMVIDADFAIVVMSHNNSGTGRCLKMLRQAKVPHEIFNPDDLNKGPIQEMEAKIEENLNNLPQLIAQEQDKQVAPPITAPRPATPQARVLLSSKDEGGFTYHLWVHKVEGVPTLRLTRAKGKDTLSRLDMPIPSNAIIAMAKFLG